MSEISLATYFNVILMGWNFLFLQEDKRAQVEKKLEENAKREKEEMKRERQELFQNRKRRQADIRNIELKMIRLQEVSNLNYHSRHWGIEYTK